MVKFPSECYRHISFANILYIGHVSVRTSTFHAAYIAAKWHADKNQLYSGTCWRYTWKMPSRMCL